MNHPHGVNKDVGEPVGRAGYDQQLPRYQFAINQRPGTIHVIMPKVHRLRDIHSRMATNQTSLRLMVKCRASGPFCHVFGRPELIPIRRKSPAEQHYQVSILRT